MVIMKFNVHDDHFPGKVTKSKVMLARLKLKVDQLLVSHTSAVTGEVSKISSIEGLKGRYYR